MSSRERVLLALAHKEPDRIPIAPPHGMVNIGEAVRQFIETFPFDRFVSLNPSKKTSRAVNQAISEQRGTFGKTVIDDFGCVYKYKGVGMPYCIYHPLANAKKAEEIEEYKKWPDPNDPSLVPKDTHKKARKLYEGTSYSTVVSLPNIFHRYQRLRGFSRWLLDMKTNHELHQALADRIHNRNMTLALRLLNEVGDYTNLAMIFDDMGGTTGPFMSLADFRRFVKPYYRQLIEKIRREFPEIKFWFHCHGNIMQFVRDIIDCGFDVLNPILPGDNMKPEKLKKKFGRQLSFDGGVDVEFLLPFGRVGEVQEHARKVIETLAAGGGYIFRVQMISNVVPARNLYAAYRTALECGGY